MPREREQEVEGHFGSESEWKAYVNDGVEKANSSHEVLFGKDGEFGLVHRFAIVWQMWVWVLCTASAGVGVIGTLIVQYLSKGASP